MDQTAESGAELETQTLREARVSLLIPTHALPPLSYRIPEHLKDEVRVGTMVGVPLSGYSRLGIVVAIGDGERASEDIRSVHREHSLPAEIVELSLWISNAAAVPLTSVLRAALPPGMNTSSYRILNPLPGWPWQAGKIVSRPALRRTLGGEGLRTSEEEERIELAVQEPGRRTIEWASVTETAASALDRAPRQRELFKYLSEKPEGYPVKDLLSETGASRATLRALADRGAVYLERMQEPPPMLNCRDSSGAEVLESFTRQAGRIVDVGGAWMWRMPADEQANAVAAVARAAIEGEEQTLILVPEIDAVENLAGKLQDLLPTGRTVAAYHSGLGRHRAATYEAAGGGRLDVLVGTRSAALIPMPRLGATCVVDEPDGGHRGEPGYEGLPIHVREIVRERGWIEGSGTLFLSPYPSLKLYAEKPEVRELPARPAREWPSASILDIRGTGLSLSPTLIESCRLSIEAGGRVGIVANRLGHATSVSCNACGKVQSCPNCDLPLSLNKRLLTCARCGYSKEYSEGCGACGSNRLTPTGLAVERVREEVSRALGQDEVGLLTAAEQDKPDAPIVVGTAHRITGRKWDMVAISDVDALLQGSGIGSVERAFRLIFAAAEAARERLVVQTRYPEHYALQAALRGDYPAFAAAELPRMRDLGYPPYGHLVALTFNGTQESVRRAVESRLRPDLDPAVTMSEPVPVSGDGEASTWKVLLRSTDRKAASQSVGLATSLARSGDGTKIRIEIDPEEV